MNNESRHDRDSESLGLNSDDLERISEFVEQSGSSPTRVEALQPTQTPVEPRDVDVFDRSTSTISANECERLRYLAHEHDTTASDLRPLTGAGSTRTITKHLSGDCSHDQEIEPQIASLSADRHRVVSPAECETYRHDVREDNASVYSLAKKRDGTPSRTTIKRHVRGECTHDIDEPPVPGDSQDDEEESEAANGGATA